MSAQEDLERAQALLATWREHNDASSREEAHSLLSKYCGSPVTAVTRLGYEYSGTLQQVLYDATGLRLKFVEPLTYRPVVQRLKSLDVQ